MDTGDAPGGPSEGAGDDPTATASREATPDEAPSGGAALQEAWRTALAGTSNLSGVGLALRGTRLRETGTGAFLVEAPAGLADDLEAYLGDPRSLPVRAALARELGLPETEVRLGVRDSGPPRRMTAEAARRQRLEDMAGMDPSLREAVEELDLSIKE